FFLAAMPGHCLLRIDLSGEKCDSCLPLGAADASKYPTSSSQEQANVLRSRPRRASAHGHRGQPLAAKGCPRQRIRREKPRRFAVRLVSPLVALLSSHFSHDWARYGAKQRALAKVAHVYNALGLKVVLV